MICPSPDAIIITIDLDGIFLLKKLAYVLLIWQLKRLLCQLLETLKRKPLMAEALTWKFLFKPQFYQNIICSLRNVTPESMIKRKKKKILSRSLVLISNLNNNKLFKNIFNIIKRLNNKFFIIISCNLNLNINFYALINLDR